MSITNLQTFDVSKVSFSKPYDLKNPSNPRQTYTRVYVSYDNDKLFIRNSDMKTFIKSFSENSHTANIHLTDDNTLLVNKIHDVCDDHLKTLGGLDNLTPVLYETPEYNSLNTKIITNYETGEVSAYFIDSEGKQVRFNEVPKSFTGDTIIQLDSIYIGKTCKLQFSLSEAQFKEAKKQRPRFL